MLELDALVSVQNEIPVYITKISVEKLKYLSHKKILRVEKYQKGEGYQREKDEKRVQSIAKFISGYKGDELIWPILAGSVILNIPNKEDLEYNDGKIKVKSTAKMNIVDGQHRIFGLIESNLDSFELPVSIIAGLDEFKEAAQFLIINTKQVKVRPDLTLTVLHDINLNETNVLIEKLKGALGVEEWQMEATHLAIRLNNEPSSPWKDYMLRPNESRNEEKKRGRDWIPVNQASFVDSLRTYCQKKGSMQYIDAHQKQNFLAKMWRKIREMNQIAFDYANGKNYILTSGAGIGPLNTLAPLLFHLEYANVVSLYEALPKIFRKYPIEQWKKKGKIGRDWGTSQKEFKTHASELAKVVCPSLDVLNQKSYDNYEKVYHHHPAMNVRRAYNALNPLIFRADAFIEKDLSENPGCYCLLRFYEGKPKVYIGQTNDVKKRLKEHKKKAFSLYSFVSVKKEELNQVESALYHLVAQKYLINQKHPPNKDENCEFCKLRIS